VEIRSRVRSEDDDIHDTDYGSNRTGFDDGYDQTSDNVVNGSLVTSLSLVQIVEQEERDENICEHGQTDP